MVFVVRKSIAKSVLKSIQGGNLEKGGFGIGTVRVWKGKRYKKAENGKWVRLYENKAADIKHDGEFVLSSKGSKDFGEITPEIASAIKREAGKIRLRVGQQKGNKEDYGELHLERGARLKDLQSSGFNSARDFTEFVCNDYDAIYPNGSGLIIYKKGKKHNQLYIQLTPSKEGEFYDVKTGVASNREQMRNKKPLWTKPNSGLSQSEKESAHDNQFNNESPLRDLAGNSDNSNIARSFDSVKKKDINKSFIMEVREIINRKEA